MKLFYVPENIAQQNPFNPSALTQKNHYARVVNQSYKPLAPEELDTALHLSAHSQVISFSPIGFERLLNSGAIIENDMPADLQESDAPTAVHYKCNFHILSPIYSAVNKFLGMGVILLGAGVPVYTAIPIALVGATCNFWVQYNFITKSANGPKNLDYQHDKLVPVNPGHHWRDECMAAATVISSITEGAGFAAGVFLSADANHLGLTSSLALCAIAFKFRQGTTMQADGQKIFIEHGKNFAKTYVGQIANLTQQLPPRYPFLIDFNSWIRDFLPALESFLPAMAFNAFLQQRVSNAGLCLALSTLVSSGEWYQQRGFSVNLIKHVQKLANTVPPMGFAYLVDGIIRLYNASIGNFVNGRFVNDAIGIVIPPAIWELVVKIAGNFFTGYVGGKEVMKLLPDIADKMGITFPENFSVAEDYVKPIVGAICAIAAYSQYTAGYDKNLGGQPIGIKPLLEQVYENANVLEFNTQAIKQRFLGWRHHIAQSPQRFFKEFHDVLREGKFNHGCVSMDDEIGVNEVQVDEKEKDKEKDKENNNKNEFSGVDLEKGLSARLMG